MKKHITFLSLVMLLAMTIPYNTKAQNKVWSMGPEVGISLSRYGMDAGDNDYKPGGLGGLFLTYSILNTFAVTTKVLYYQKGASFAVNNTKQTLNYVEVPIIGRFFLNKEGAIRPNIFVGPSFGFLTGAKQNVDNKGNEDISDYKNIYNGVDVGVTGGLGFNFLLFTETYLILDARYTHGLSDLSKANGKVNNNSFALSAGISFGF
ncbi:MAG: PorT family protein [Cyclobacteriaceae bacterium]|nr:PorT family protein [Cyclobacteriaceae bacterium]